MSQRLKRWESPEKGETQGRGGSARSRQLKKQTQMLRQRLKEGGEESQSVAIAPENNKDRGETIFPFCYVTLIAAARYCSKSSFNQKLSGLVHLNLSSHPQPERPLQRVSSSS